MPLVTPAAFPIVKGAVVASTAALVDITPVPAYSVPAGIVTVGTTFRVTAYGRYTCGATATNLTLGLYWGGTAGQVLAATAATALTVSQTNAPWELEATFTIDGLGSGTSGSIWTKGRVFLGTAPGTYATPLPIPNAAAAAVGVDTTIARQISIGATLSQITGSPTITCDRLIIENITTTP